MVTDNDSAPCFAHKLVGGHVVDPQTHNDVAVFRKSQRERLFALMAAQTTEARQIAARSIEDKLDNLLDDMSGRTVAAYRPVDGHLDLRRWMSKAASRGATILLPNALGENEAFDFYPWVPDVKKADSHSPKYDGENSKPGIPDIIIIPFVGVDKDNYRLGSGNGFYDRTLSNMPSETLTVGVGQSFAQMETIFPMPWDIPMRKVLLADRH